MTISANIGVAAVYLHPIDRARAGVLALAEGGTYEVLGVGPDGSFSSTGLALVTRGEPAVAAGYLAYTTAVVYRRPVEITGRLRVDTGARARAVLDYMGDVSFLTASNISALFLVESRELLGDLTHDELIEVFDHVGRAGELGRLLNLVSVPRFRDFLRERGVSWDYVVQNWEPSINDSLAVFAGVVVGAGENVYQVLELIGILIGSLSASLAQRRHDFWLGIVAFAEHPITTSEAGLRLLRDTFMRHLMNLEFFDAGRIIGNAAVTILTLPCRRPCARCRDWPRRWAGRPWRSCASPSLSCENSGWRCGTSCGSHSAPSPTS